MKPKIKVKYTKKEFQLHTREDFLLEELFCPVCKKKMKKSFVGKDKQKKELFQIFKCKTCKQKIVLSASLEVKDAQ